jgi:pimeloyl-[acyl-carrier protein] methyl ester esterase
MITIQGDGPDLVMIHGWGMNNRVWGEFAERLAKRFTLHLVELPGHEEANQFDGEFTMENLVQELSKQLPKAACLGWSLGGLVAARLALNYPQKVESLILLSTNPSFVKNGEWQAAQDPEVFERFSEALESDIHDTLDLFNRLQVAGSAMSRQVLQLLQNSQSKLPTIECLRSGLNILRRENLSADLGDIKTPCLVIGGSEDRLVPIDAVRLCAGRIRGAKLHIFEGAGHAPFLSHTVEAESVVSNFLKSRLAA